MMMVVTVMAVDLHLHSNYRLRVGIVKEFFLEAFLPRGLTSAD